MNAPTNALIPANAQQAALVMGTWTREQVDRHVLRRTWYAPSDCLLFLGYKNHGGYGVVKIARRAWLAHRAVWCATNGMVPVGYEICHTCDQPACVNLAHLFVGTRSDNMQDMLRKGRGHKARGEGHGRAKLTTAQVVEARQLNSAGASQASLARHFGISKSTMHQIVRRKNWSAL